MRGTAHETIFKRLQHGIIPAHAGNSCGACVWAVGSKDHPRACGEQLITTAVEKQILGSSPRMRGTGTPPERGSKQYGIIPAHAGNSKALVLRFSQGRDHPRACGEQTSYHLYSVLFWGSSPRMRGTEDKIQGVHQPEGIIPAHAGNRWSLVHTTSHARDHPRACGEQPIALRLSTAGLGSSPRMRGTEDTKMLYWQGTGIIPAHAGNSRKGKAALWDCRDHPRACGEQISQTQSCIC